MNLISWSHSTLNRLYSQNGSLICASSVTTFLRRQKAFSCSVAMRVLCAICSRLLWLASLERKKAKVSVLKCFGQVVAKKAHKRAFMCEIALLVANYLKTFVWIKHTKIFIYASRSPDWIWHNLLNKSKDRWRIGNSKWSNVATFSSKSIYYAFRFSCSLLVVSDKTSGMCSETIFRLSLVIRIWRWGERVHLKPPEKPVVSVEWLATFSLVGWSIIFDIK